MPNDFSPTQAAILKCTIDGNGDWQSIMQAVSKVRKVKNWMTVRGELQALIDARLIKRVLDVSREVYVITENYNA